MTLIEGAFLEKGGRGYRMLGVQGRIPKHVAFGLPTEKEGFMYCNHCIEKGQLPLSYFCSSSLKYKVRLCTECQSEYDKNIPEVSRQRKHKQSLSWNKENKVTMAVRSILSGCKSAREFYGSRDEAEKHATELSYSKFGEPTPPRGYALDHCHTEGNLRVWTNNHLNLAEGSIRKALLSHTKSEVCSDLNIMLSDLGLHVTEKG